MSEIESKRNENEYIEPKPADQITTLDEARARIIELEDALMPFAQIGILMANAGMMLHAAGRGDEPPGGYWISRQNNIQMQPNFPLFSMAMSRYGFVRSLQFFNTQMVNAQAATMDREDAEKELTPDTPRQ